MSEPRSLPTGTVTFLFSDIEGSTRLLGELGDRYASVLSDHHRLVRAALRRWGGHEVDSQGDALFIAFARATDAVAAVEAQRALAAFQCPAGVVVRVRMGLHTGEPLVTETGYVGMDVHRAARIAAAVHGQQILVSDATRALLGTDLRQPTARASPSYCTVLRCFKNLAINHVRPRRPATSDWWSSTRAT